MHMNRYDVADAFTHYAERPDLPNYFKAADILAELVDWVDRHSDGWPYWSKPGLAALKLQKSLWDWRGRYVKDDNADLTREELVDIVRPVKSFLTKQGHRPDDAEHANSAIQLRGWVEQQTKAAS